MSKSDDKTTSRNVSRRKFLQTTAIAGAIAAAPTILTRRKARAAQAGVPTAKDPRFCGLVVDPKAIAQFVTPLPVPGTGGWPIINAGSQDIRLVPRTVTILPVAMGLSTPVWCYRGRDEYASTYLGPTM